MFGSARSWFVGAGAACLAAAALDVAALNAAKAAVLEPGKPDLAVSAADGRLASYSAALPLELKSFKSDAVLTARIAGSSDAPTYDLNFNFADTADYTHRLKRNVSLGASWNADEAQLRSSLVRNITFGVIPSANLLAFSVDMNAKRAFSGDYADARADLRSSLTLGGQQVGSISVGRGAMGDETLALSLMRPLRLPAELTVSRSLYADGTEDQRFSMRLVQFSF